MPVSFLIDAPRRCWKLDVLHELFDDMDVRLILQIPLRLSMQSDLWYWSASRSGSYSVKSGYYIWLDQ